MTCPWCASTDTAFYSDVITAPYFPVDIHGEFINCATVTRYEKCAGCGLVFQPDRKPDAWYDWFYSSGTYRATLGISQEVMDADEYKRALDLVPVVMRHVDESNIKKHLDIGASRGLLLKYLKRELRCLSKGSDPYTDYSQAEYDEFDTPDLVSAIHVLEHVTHPRDELQKWAELTSRYLLIEVPGEKCKGGPLRFAHLWYFPPELLRAEIERLGFKIVASETEPDTRILAEKLGIDTQP